MFPLKNAARSSITQASSSKHTLMSFLTINQPIPSNLSMQNCMETPSLTKKQPTSHNPKTSRGRSGPVPRDLYFFGRRKLRWWSTLWCHGFACFLPREWNKSFVNPSTRLDANHLAMGKLEGRKYVGPLPSHQRFQGKYSHHASPTWIENLVENWHVLLQPLLVFGKSGMLWLHFWLPK